jgi:hypothetical protein
MYLKNLRAKTIYYRGFNKNDTFQAVGFADGVLRNGEQTQVDNNDDAVRLEIKDESFFGRFILRATTQYPRNLMLVITDNATDLIDVRQNNPGSNIVDRNGNVRNEDSPPEQDDRIDISDLQMELHL